MKPLLVLLILSQVLSAQQQIPDSLRTIIDREKSDTARILRSCRLSFEIQYSDPGIASVIASDALEKSKEIKFDKGIANSLTQLGNIQQVRGNYDSSEALNKKALAIRMDIHDYRGAAISYNNLGILAHSRNNYPLALKYYRKSLSVNRAAGNKSGEATALYCIGTVNENQTAYDSALFYYFAALTISESISDQRLTGYGKLSLANVYFMMENYPAAKDYYSQASEIYEKPENAMALVKIWMSLGQTAEKTGDKHVAVNYYLKALKFARKIGSPDDEANIQLSLGSLYENAGKADSAKLQYSDAANNYRITGSKHNLVLSLVSLARLSNNSSDFSAAERNLYEAGRIASEIKSPSANSALFFETSQTLAGLKDYEGAWNFMKKYSQLKDSLMSDEKQKQILELQTRYETDKKEKENIILRQKGKILTTTRNSLIGGAALLVIIAMIILRSLVIKKKDNRLLRLQKKEIMDQNEVLEIQKKEITDSIHYAGRIQNAMLPVTGFFSHCLPESFILYLPRDIVSGDFYWVRKIDNGRSIICVADCTGHGVPGAFMSVLGISLLNEISSSDAFAGSNFSPSFLLNMLRERVKKSLKQTGREGEARDGMDMSVCLVNKGTGMISYSGANNPVYIVHDSELTELKATRNPIGIYPVEVAFRDQDFCCRKGSMVYMFSDGFSDQIGENGSKFLSRQLKSLLREISNNDPDRIKQMLYEKHISWKGREEQVDDIFIAGFRV